MASTIVCRQYSAKDATDLLENVGITVQGDQVHVHVKGEERTYMPAAEEDKTVIGHWTSTQPGTQERYSVIVIESRDKEGVYPPTVYFVDWAGAKLGEASTPFDREPVAQMDTRYQCGRID